MRRTGAWLAAVLVVASAGAAPAAARDPLLVFEGKGVALVNLPATEITAFQGLTGGGDYGAVLIEPVAGDGPLYGVLAVPAFGRDAGTVVGETKLPAGRYRVHVQTAKPGKITLRLRSGPSRVVRARGTSADTAGMVTQATPAGQNVAAVVRQRVNLTGNSLVIVGARAAQPNAQGIENVRMGVCLTDADAPCESGAYTGSLAVGAVGDDGHTFGTFAGVRAPEGARDAAAYFYGSPTMMEATAVVVAFTGI